MMVFKNKVIFKNVVSKGWCKESSFHILMGKMEIGIFSSQWGYLDSFLKMFIELSSTVIRAFIYKEIFDLI